LLKVLKLLNNFSENWVQKGSMFWPPALQDRSRVRRGNSGKVDKGLEVGRRSTHSR